MGGDKEGRYYKFNLEGVNGIYEGTIKKGVLYNYAAMNSNKLCPVGWHVPTDDDWLIFIKTFCGSDKYEWEVSLTEYGILQFEKVFNGNFVCAASDDGQLFFNSAHASWPENDGGHLWSSSGRYLYYHRGDMFYPNHLGLGKEREKGELYSYCVRCIKDAQE